MYGVSKKLFLTKRIYNCHLLFFCFYNKHSSFFTALCVTDVREVLLGVAPRTRSVSLYFFLPFL